ncbi:tripartite tricarboxylate transporter TctB family protein [uncultured Oscillibacter sp.]|uniref:tripartite tricarboxylate transporter TctB family protein n=1 Tax=uncultured Oscillibacter sp. TaxID=876091 RepID=UPI0025D39286|nr:tripartite tricarboxylate transporter TctB family protein [uncultured Oscillibacter sp.]
MEKAKFNSRALIPIATAIIAAIFIGVGLKDFDFWDDQPTAAFIPIIIAVVLLATSILCLVQVLRGKEPAPVYNKNELMVILGGGGIIIGCYVIGLILSCLLYLFLWLKVIEKASWKAIIIIEVFMAALILGVFVFWMQVQFPMGLLANLM